MLNANENQFAGHLEGYGIIQDKYLPEEVAEELVNESQNDTGKIVNPAYRPLFKAWLESENLPSDKCYIVWWSW